MMKKLLFRADDLGYSEGVNQGIAKCVSQGLIRSTGVMINMETAQQGLELLKGQSVSIGIHCNISNGTPLADPTKVCSLLNEQGLFKKTKEYAQGEKDIVNLEEIMLEAEAQYERFVQLTGTKPAYMDGHAVASANFFRGIELVAKRHGVKYSPFPHDASKPISIGTSNVFMHAGSTLEVGPMESLHSIVEQAKEDEIHMIVYHPGFIDAFILRNSSLTIHRAFETEMLCDPAAKAYLEEQQIQCITYDEL